MRRIVRFLAVALLLAPPAAAAARRDELRIVPIDVEGGAATLFVTPGHHGLLVDTGWPARLGQPSSAPGEPRTATPSSAQRIVAAARAAGLSRLDYVLITHYHVDHVGGFEELAAFFPIGTVIDHGPNREASAIDATPSQRANAPATLYPRYIATIGARRHRVLHPGDTLTIDGLAVTAIDSDRQIPNRPLPGASMPGSGCASATSRSDIGGEENARSLGIVARWGRARILALGDTTWNVENSLVCPIDRIGKVDLMMADNHGSGNSNSPLLLATVRARVFVINNGATKGADAATLATVAALPGGVALWQLHFARRSPGLNAPSDRIANVPGLDAHHALDIAIARDGTIRIANPRIGTSETYAAAERR